MINSLQELQESCCLATSSSAIEQDGAVPVNQHPNEVAHSHGLDGGDKGGFLEVAGRGVVGDGLAEVDEGIGLRVKVVVPQRPTSWDGQLTTLAEHPPPPALEDSPVLGCKESPKGPDYSIGKVPLQCLWGQLFHGDGKLALWGGHNINMTTRAVQQGSLARHTYIIAAFYAAVEKKAFSIAAKKL